MYSTKSEASKAVRQAMKDLSLKVNVRIAQGNPNQIQVYTKTYDAKFTEDEKRYYGNAMTNETRARMMENRFGFFEF